MEIINLKDINFKWEDLISFAANKRLHSLSADMKSAAERAYVEGLKLLELKAIFELYKVEDIRQDSENINLFSYNNSNREKLLIGSRISYLFPAKEAAVILCTSGKPLADAMASYSIKGEYLMMYYLDVFAVKALAEISANIRCRIETIAGQKGWGAGPSMQPGSVIGWDVSGQADLFRLAHGEQIGLSLNDAHLLIPHISNSTLVGIGPDYMEKNIGSMCHECERKDECLWRRENVKQ